MIERGRGRQSATIDDFYTVGPGADRRPPGVGGVAVLDPARIVESVVLGQPIVLIGDGEALEQHYVLVVGFKQDQQGQRKFVALDPWPGVGQIAPARTVEIVANGSQSKYPDLGVTFKHMRLVASVASDPNAAVPKGAIVGSGVSAQPQPLGPTPPTVIAFDGVHLTSGEGYNYLAPQLRRLWGIEVATVPWSGDIKDDAQYRNYVSLAEQLIADLVTAASNRAVVIIGHSWGSVVAYDALTKLEQRLAGRSASHLRPIVLITLGSPLQNPLVDRLLPDHFKLTSPTNIRRPTLVRRWFNYLTSVRNWWDGQDVYDIIGSCIDGADVPPTHQNNCALLVPDLPSEISATLPLLGLVGLSPSQSPQILSVKILSANLLDQAAFFAFFSFLHNAYFGPLAMTQRNIDTITAGIVIATRSLRDEQWRKAELVGPRIEGVGSQSQLVMPPAMHTALKQFDSSFVPFTGYDYPKPETVAGVSAEQAPFAIVADFNGDGIPDVMVDGRSAAGGRRICLLSRFGHYTVLEIERFDATLPRQSAKVATAAPFLKLLRTTRLYDSRSEVHLTTDAVQVMQYANGAWAWWAWYYERPNDLDSSPSPIGAFKKFPFTQP
jgi:pimeloyl-ACP methyl ester carboxylesterase